MSQQLFSQSNAAWQTRLCKKTHSVRGKQKPGFSVLELIIALALLATLMVVAWSILASYRVAEQRGWQQTYRLRVMSVARAWLVQDAACGMKADSWERGNASVASQQPSFPGNQEVVFRGTSREIVWQQIPAVDPLPWLDEVTSSWQPLRSPGVSSGAGASSSAAASSVTGALSDRELELGPAGRGPLRQTVRLDPLELGTVTYRLLPDGVTSDDQPVYRLQRQLRAAGGWAERSEGESETSSADQLLTVDDLYRTEQPAATAELTGGPLMSSAIRHLVSPRFRYCDGENWLDQWDSQLRMSLPTAIELSFDFPPASSPYQVTRQQPAEPGDLPAGGLGDELGNDMGEVQPALRALPAEAEATPSGLEGGGEIPLRDVRIVVRIPGQGSMRSGR
jgi:prepilin-type N-terminal cleavage/methylation domain-containing protein